MSNSPSQPKTFRAEDMKSALLQVREELGPEALILSTREVPGGAAWQVWKTPQCLKFY